MYRPRVGAYWTLSSSSRVSSTFVRDAASTSIRSMNRPASISRQAEQVPSGSAVTPFSQFRHLAKMRAMVVLPTPRVPVNRNAWWTRPESSAFTSARRTCSCPTSSLKVLGRHFRASAVYAAAVMRLDSDSGGGPHQLELRHPTSPLPLLPSGPDGIHDWSSRRSRREPP